MFKSAAFWVLSLICQTSGFNISRLMTIYIEACGEKHMCVDWPGVTKYQPHLVLSRCQPCSCEESCFQDLNCCPDKFFQRPLAVLDTPHVHMEKTSKLDLRPMYEIITTCPEFSTEIENQKCENVSVDFDSNNPVSSLVSNHSYRNIFCAYCHGEIELNLVKWDLSIDAEFTNVNFVNFIESYQQLRLLSKTQRATVVYSPSASMEEIVRPIFLHPDRYFTQSCPDDEDLDIACSSSYVNQFRLHKNIFCYLCKLKRLKRNGPIIDSCSSQINETIQKCRQSSISSITYPYKNFYCFQCNIPLRNLEIAEARRCHGSDCEDAVRYHFSDFSTNAREIYISDRMKKKKFYIKFHNTTLSSDSILRMIRDSNKSGIHFPVETVEQNNGGFVQLFNTIAAINPYRLCRRDLLPDSVGNLTRERQCDCSYSCLFLGRCTCCIDTALLHPVECINRVSPFSKTQTKGSILVVSRCYKNNMELKSTIEYEKVKHLCEENPNDYNILILSRNITYRNIFCFLCNTNYTIEHYSLIHDPYKVVDFYIICEFQFNFIYSTNFSQFIQQAKTQMCDVTHYTSELVTCDHKASVSTWNCPRIEKDWVVKWMCENPSPQAFMPMGRFKNEFCQMCNSNEIGDIKACNHSDIFDVKFKNACLTLPDVRNHPFVHPFRNQFCSHCEGNEALMENTIFSRTNCEPTYGTVKPHVNPLMRELYFPKIELSEQLLKRKVQKMDHICYPGRVLVGGDCRPVIRNPKRITYALYILCQLNVTSTSNDSSKIISIASNSVGESLSLRFAITNVIVFSEYFFLPISPIVTTFTEGYFHFTLQVNLYFELTYVKRFDRDKVERDLLALPANLSMKVKAQGDEYISMDLKGIRLSDIKALKSQEIILPDVYALFVAQKYSLFLNLVPSNFVYVSNLLLCRQRMFSESEVEFDTKNGHITAKRTKEIFYIGEYVVDFDKKYRVCVQSDQSYIKSSERDYADKLETFTTVLNIISILFLLILFVIYMKVPGLRTLPGLNIMNTTISLFCMQVTYTAANVLRRSSLLCQITGVILHYFWLSQCCCLFICSLHMFRTFSSHRYKSGNNRGQNIRSIFTCYTFFCYFTPLIIVVANVMFTFGLEGNIGYGKYLCFVENLAQNIATFVVPLTVTCTVNTVLFILTLLNINFVKNIRKSKENTSELLISIKLFSLTGTVWILQVLDSLLHISVFSFVVTFLTSSQGFFIFLSFSTSSRILKYLESLLGKRNNMGLGEKMEKCNIEATLGITGTTSNTLEASVSYNSTGTA